MKTLTKFKIVLAVFLSALIIPLCFIVGMKSGSAIGKMVKSNSNISNAIEKTLQENCNCETITADIKAFGIKYSKEDGFSNTSLSFILKNCDYRALEEAEVVRLNSILKKDISDYNSIDIIQLSFQSNDEEKVVKIKNGKII